MVDMVEVEEDSAAADTSEDTGDNLDTDVNFESESEEGSAETYSESDDLGSSDADFSSGENMFTDGTSESSGSAPAEEAAQPVSCIVNLKNETIEIKAEAPAGVLPNGTQMIVKAVENNTEDAEMTDQYNKLAAKITEQLQSQGKNLDGFLAYNVSFKDADGNPVEPSDKVTYSFTYKEASSPELTDPAASTVTAAMIRTNKETSELELTELKAEEDKLTVETNESKQLTKAAFQSAATAAYTFVWSSTPAADDNENNENKEENSEVNNGEVNTDTNIENTEENGEVNNEEVNTDTNTENTEENGEETPDQEQIKMIRITADEVNLRVAPSTEADVIATVDTDTQLPLLETVTGEDEFTWYRVSYDETEAYVRSDMAEVVENEEQDVVIEEDEEADQTVRYESTVDGVTIVVTAPDASVLPENAELVATKIDNTEEIEQIKDAIAPEVVNNQTSIKDMMAFDIKFMVDDEEVQPNGEVKVEFQNTGYDTENGISVYHVDDEKTTATDMQAVVEEKTTDTVMQVASEEETTDAAIQVVSEEGGEQVSETTGANVAIDTTHFSTYVVVNNGDDKINVTIQHYLYDTATNTSSELYKEKTLEVASKVDEGKLSEFTAENDEFRLRTEADGGPAIVKIEEDGTPTPVTEDRILVDKNVTIRCYYVAETGKTYTNSVTMFDYDITSTGKGINTLSNYSNPNSTTDKMMMGQKNETGLDYTYNINGYNINNNNKSSRPIIPGIITSLSDESTNYSQVNFKEGIDEPGFFSSESKTGKRILDNYYLNFAKTGNKYTLESVSKKDGTNDTIVANDLKKFWPLDNDPGDDGLNGGSDDGGRHNWYFAMRYDFKFRLGDYMGDLTYRFNGDDDLWVFMDGEPIIDLGGLHSAYPENDFVNNPKYNRQDYDYSSWTSSYPNTVNLWTRIAGGKEGADREKEHTITVLFMERGGFGSNCNMEFVLPNVTSTEPVISTTPKADLNLTKVDSKNAAIKDVEFKLVNGNNEVKATSGENGRVTFSNLREGTEYTLNEVSAPKEYVAETTTWKVKVESDTSGTLKAVLYKGDEPLTLNDDGTYHIVNYTQEELVSQSVESNKTVSLLDWDQRTYKIDLTASSKVKQTTTVAVPFDIVMVLDVSGSMDNDFYEYSKYTGKLSEGNKYYIKTSSGIYEQIENYYTGSWGNWTLNWRYRDTYTGEYVEVTQGSTEIFTKKKSIKKLKALQNAATSFVENVAAKNPDNRISVVTFAGSSSIKARKNDAKWLLRTGNSIDTIKSWISKLSANGATNSADGLGNAVKVFNSKNSDKWEDVTQNTGRQKMVVFLTDGVPTKSDEFSSTVANKAISNASELEEQGATIYSLGIFDSATSKGIMDGYSATVKDVDDYMKGVASSEEKYMTADSVSSLNGLFDSITNSMPVVVTATVTDIIDKRFELTADSRTTLEAGGATITDNSDGSTTITWANTEILGKKDSGTTDIEKAGWHKEIYIRAKDAYIGGNDVPTNGTGSGINVGNNHLEFPKRTVNVKSDLVVNNKAVTIFYGDTVPTDSEIINALFNENAPQGFVTKLDKDSKPKPELVTYTMGADGKKFKPEDFTLEWYKDLNFTEENKISKEELAQQKPGLESKEYYLKVTYNALRDATDQSNANTTKDNVPHVAGEGGKITAHNSEIDQSRLYGIYKVNVISGQIQITKKLDAESNAPTTFTFDIKKGNDPIATATAVVDARSKEANVTYKLKEGVDSQIKVDTTDASILTGLARGEYTITETPDANYTFKEAIAGTRTNCKSSESANGIAFTMGTYTTENGDVEVLKNGNTDIENGRIGVAEFTNKKSVVDIDFEKVDIQTTDTKLSGAEFALYKADVNGDQTTAQVGTYTSGNQGRIAITDLPIGNYVLVETKAPAGYQCSAIPWKITVADNRTITVTYNNNQVEPNNNIYQLTNTKVYSLPSTGGSGIYWYMIGGMVLMSTAAWILYKNKCREVLGR